MTWTYRQSTGDLLHNGRFVALGYSGYPPGRNEPRLQEVPSIGPLPRGSWGMIEVFDSKEHGPFCIRLMPLPGTQDFGRSGFLVHGEKKGAGTNGIPAGMASRGCLIFSRAVREQMWRSEDSELEVVA